MGRNLFLDKLSRFVVFLESFVIDGCFRLIELSEVCFYVLKFLYCYFYSLMIDLIEVEKERLLDEVSFL